MLQSIHRISLRNNFTELLKICYLTLPEQILKKQFKTEVIHCYECQCCSEQCRVYVGSAPGAVSAKATAVTAASLFVIMIGNRVNS